MLHHFVDLHESASRRGRVRHGMALGPWLFRRVTSKLSDLRCPTCRLHSRLSLRPRLIMARSKKSFLAISANRKRSSFAHRRTGGRKPGFLWRHYPARILCSSPLQSHRQFLLRRVALDANRATCRGKSFVVYRHNLSRPGSLRSGTRNPLHHGLANFLSWNAHSGPTRPASRDRMGLASLETSILSRGNRSHRRQRRREGAANSQRFFGRSYPSWTHRSCARLRNRLWAFAHGLKRGVLL